MPDGGATETVVAEEILADGAAEAAADGAAAAATDAAATDVAATAGADAAATAAGEAGAASLALDGAGELAQVPALTSATGADVAASTAGGADGLATSEITGAGPAAQTGATTTVSNTDQLAQQILNPGTAETPSQSLSTDAINNPGVAEAPKQGIIDRAMSFADKHPMAATMAGTQIAGAVGGVGKAALEKEIAERNIRARADLLTQQSAAALQQSRAGALPGGGVGVKPALKVLRRPDGTAVFAPSGIINSNIAQGG